MKVLTIVIACFFFATSAFASEESLTAAEHIARAKTSPTLKAWHKKEVMHLGLEDAGYRMNGPKDLCETMKSVGLGCSYNERGELVQFLSAQGVDLFPCEEGSNPYTSDMCEKATTEKRGSGFDNYIGQPMQNAMLKKSIEKNRLLFKDGDLTAAAARAWKK